MTVNSVWLMHSRINMSHNRKARIGLTRGDFFITLSLSIFILSVLENHGKDLSSKF